jgi:hypothetical protein
MRLALGEGHARSLRRRMNSSRPSQLRHTWSMRPEPSAPRRQRHALAIATGLEVGGLVLRVLCLADVDHVLLADVQPVHREAELRVRAVPEPEAVDEPVARGFRVVRQDQDVFRKRVPWAPPAARAGCRITRRALLAPWPARRG